MATDYTDPSTIDVDEVIANINHDYKARGYRWSNVLSWPNITVKALADEILRLRKKTKRAEAKNEMQQAREDIKTDLSSLIDKYNDVPNVNYLRTPLQRALKELV